MNKLILVICSLILSSNLYAGSLKFGDCVKVEDEFYGTNYGLVVNRSDDKQKYQVWISVYFTSWFASEQLTKVEKEYCEEEETPNE